MKIKRETERNSLSGKRELARKFSNKLRTSFKSDLTIFVVSNTLSTSSSKLTHNGGSLKFEKQQIMVIPWEV